MNYFSDLDEVQSKLIPELEFKCFIEGNKESLYEWSKLAKEHNLYFDSDFFGLVYFVNSKIDEKDCSLKFYYNSFNNVINTFMGQNGCIVDNNLHLHNDIYLSEQWEDDEGYEKRKRLVQVAGFDKKVLFILISAFMYKRQSLYDEANFVYFNDIKDKISNYDEIKKEQVNKLINK